MQVEDVLATLQFQLVLVVTRVDRFHRLVGLFAVEPEVVRGGVAGEVVVDAERFLVEDEVELGVLQRRKTLRRLVVH